MEVERPLSARGLVKIYRSRPFAAPVHALRGVDLEIDPGTVLGLVGPNGSGKTTAIRCALGLLHPTAGEVRVFGAPPLTPRARRGIGFAPERFALSGRRTGLETLLLLGRLAGLRGADLRRRAGAALERLDLAGAAARPVRGYSKGMTRRLSLAAAIQHDPRLLVLDEPFDGLDPLGSAAVRDELRRLAGSGCAVLLSSHALHEVESIATHLLVLDRGAPLVHGERDQVLRQEGVVELRAADLDDETLDELAALIARRGGRLLRRGPARGTLEDLFRRRVGGSGP